MPKAFISHAISDRALIERLLRDPLHELAVETWFCEQDIVPGENWVTSINAGLSDSDWFVLALTPRSVKSKYVLAELQTALTLSEAGKKPEKWIIPVLLEPCQPVELHPLLTIIQHIDFTLEPQAGLRRLAKHVRQGDPPALVVGEPSKPPRPLEERHEFRDDLRWAESVAKEIGELAYLAEEFRHLRDRLDRGLLHVQIHGEFRRGKTTLFRALTDVPGDDTPDDDVPDDDDRSLSSANRSEAAYVRAPRLGVALADTTGLGERDLPDPSSADAHILVVSPPEGAGTAAERNCLSRLAAQGNPATILVCNKLDLVREAERQQFCDYIRHRFRDVMPWGLEEICFLSALQGLEGRREGRDDLLQKSNVSQLEALLRNLAQNQRQALVTWGVAHRLRVIVRRLIAPVLQIRRRVRGTRSMSEHEPEDRLETILDRLDAAVAGLSPPSLRIRLTPSEIR